MTPAQRHAIYTEVRKRLVSNFIQANWFIIGGDCLPKEMCEKHSLIPALDVRKVMHAVAQDLERELRVMMQRGETHHHPSTEPTGHPVSECAERGCKR